MRINTQDMTLVRNYLQKYQFLFSEYELIKAKKHPKYRFLEEFYRAHDTDRRQFLKYYRRFKDAGGDLSAVLPGKRGPKWKTRRTRALLNKKYSPLEKKVSTATKFSIFCSLRLKAYSQSFYHLCHL